MKPQPDFLQCVRYGQQQRSRVSAKTDGKTPESTNRNHIAGRIDAQHKVQCCSTCLRIKTNNLWMVFLKGSPYPIGTVNLLFCVGERRYAFGLCSSIEKSCKRVSKKVSTFNTQYNCSACVGRAPTLTFWSPKVLFQKNTIFQKWHDIYKWQMNVCVELLSIVLIYGQWWVSRILQMGHQLLY